MTKYYLNYLLTGSILLACLSVSFSQGIILKEGQYHIDKSLNLIVSNQIPTLNSTPVTTIQADKSYTFDQPVTSITIGQFYSVTSNNTIYKLVFSKLPLIAIDTQGKPTSKDVVIGGSIILADTNGVIAQSPIGINVRGALSSTFPKKSYKVTFWTDSASQTSKDVSLFNMRSDSDWILLAMYNESLRINNVTSHALWRNMHQLYYLNQEPKALSAIRTQYVDVFLNGSYAGIYAIGEQIDRKQLQLKKTKDDGGIRGELYKSSDWTGATVFSGMPAKDGNDTTWAGYELKYPNQDGFWTNLYDLVDASVNWSDTKFKNQIASKWQIDNLVDYFLFLNLVRATDNTGKNLYIARYKENEPYILIAWDLDGTWGYLYEGSRNNITNDILSNGLFHRLLTLNPANFKEKLKARWFSLRKDLFATSKLKEALAENTRLLTANGAYSRESLKWSVANTDAELAYIYGWIDRRTTFLDTYFSQFPEPCANPTTPAINLSPGTITAGQSATLTATGCPYTVVWNTGATGSTLTVGPRNSSDYWAVCYQTAAACTSPASRTVTLTVQPSTDPNRAQADLSLSMSSSQLVVTRNTPVRLTLTLTNNGPDAASTIQLQNRLPQGLVYAGNASPNVGEANGIITIPVESLAADQSISFSYDVIPVVESNFHNAAQILMCATYDPDSDPGSGTADGQDDMAVVSIRTISADNAASSDSPNPNQVPLPQVLSNQPTPDPLAADLSLELQFDKRVISPGTISTLTMFVRNSGGMAATNVSVQAVLPAGLQFAGGNAVSASGNLVTATGLSVAPNSTVAVTFQVLANSTGNWVCQGQIMTSTQPDPDSTPGNGTTNGEDDSASTDVRVGS